MKKIVAFLIFFGFSLLLLQIGLKQVDGITLKETAYTISDCPKLVLPEKIFISDDEIRLLNDNILQKVSKVTSISISFAGDCTLGQDIRQGSWNTFPSVAKREGYEFFFKEVQPVFANDDLTIVNLETTLTTSETYQTRKKWRYKGNPDFANILKIGSIEAVHIPNNHMHDYLEEGFKDTLKALDDAEIIYYGNDTMSNKGNTTGGHLGYDYPRIINIKGVKVGLLGYKGWYDNEKNREKIKEDIATMKEEASIVIVTYHWGGQMVYYPDQMQKNLGRFTVDCGADLVVGHHPHVIQGIEEYKGKHIVYCLGNFSFGGDRNPRDRDCIIFQGIFKVKDGDIIKNDGVIIPCKVSSDEKINNFQPIILEGAEKERVLNRVYKYSSSLEYGINPDNSNQTTQ